MARLGVLGSSWPLSGASGAGLVCGLVGKRDGGWKARLRGTEDRAAEQSLSATASQGRLTSSVAAAPPALREVEGDAGRLRVTQPLELPSVTRPASRRARQALRLAQMDGRGCRPRPALGGPRTLRPQSEAHTSVHTHSLPSPGAVLTEHPPGVASGPEAVAMAVGRAVRLAEPGSVRPPLLIFPVGMMEGEAWGRACAGATSFRGGISIR